MWQDSPIQFWPAIGFPTCTVLFLRSSTESSRLKQSSSKKRRKKEKNVQNHLRSTSVLGHRVKQQAAGYKAGVVTRCFLARGPPPFLLLLRCFVPLSLFCHIKYICTQIIYFIMNVHRYVQNPQIIILYTSFFLVREFTQIHNTQI